MVDREPLLDHRRETRAGDARQRRVGRVGVQCAVVGAARDRRGRREQADPPVGAARRGDPRLRLDHADHIDAERRREHPLAQRRQRGRAERVAGDDQQLCATREQVLGDLERESLQIGGAVLAVGETRGVPEIEEVLMRQLDEQLLEHREAADARVEDRDRALTRWGRW